MRGSDVVDLLAELLPRPLVKVLLWLLMAGVVLFGWTAAIDWYVQDKAAGLTEMFLPVLEGMTADLVPPPAA